MVNKALIKAISKQILQSKKHQEEDEKSYSFFDYNYLDVQDLDADDQFEDFITKLNVWQLSDPNKIDFLINNLHPDHLENTVFAIVLDFTKPWDFLDQLSQWGDVIFEINKRLILQLPVTKQNKMRKKLENHFKFYKNPEKEGESEFKLTEEIKEGEENTVDEMKEALDEIPLEDGVLNVNLGIPVMLIWTKSEVIMAGDTQKYFQPRFEFITKHLREFALRYGASLIFTSAKKGTNLDIFYKYLLHRIYDFKFKIPPEITNKEGIFIPTGFDSPKIVEQLCPGIDDPYEKIINNLIPSSVIKPDSEVIDCEDWDKWLLELKDVYHDPEQEESKEAAKKNEEAKKAEVANNKVDAESFLKGLMKGSATRKRQPTTNHKDDNK